MAHAGKPKTIAVDAYKIAYQALPKAGCSSVKEALARVDPAVPIPPEDEIGHMTWHAIYPTIRFRPQRWRPYEAPEWFTFCVVRDPVKRLLSCFTDRVVQKRDLVNSPKVRASDTLTTDPDPDFFFQNLVAYRQASSSIKHHSLGADLFTGRDFSKYSRVYKTSDLGQLGMDLSERVGKAVIIPRSNSSPMKLDLDDLAPATIDAIRPFLNDQYEVLKDFYDNPMS